MALIVKDRVMESASTTGTGAFTLAGAYTGFRAFSSVCSTNDTFYYVIAALDGNGNPSGDWECGLGTYSGTNTLTRTTVHASTNSNAAVNFAAGTKRVILDATATYLALSAKTDTVNTFSALQTFSGGASMTPAATPATTAVGYLGCPQNQQDANYTTVMSDSGKHLYHTSASTHTWTIDSNANVAYPIGTILTFINASGGGNVTLAITSDTLRWGSSTGSRTLAANGTATAIKVTSTVWRLTGDGIS
jgi:hypothetical protein